MADSAVDPPMCNIPWDPVVPVDPLEPLDNGYNHQWILALMDPLVLEDPLDTVDTRSIGSSESSTGNKAAGSSGTIIQ